MAAEVVEWLDANGNSTTLIVEWDVDGRFMPPIRRIEEAVPLQAGSRHRSSRHDSRDVRMLVAVDAVDETTLRTQLRSLVYAMDPSRGDGRLRVTAPAGDQRELTCRYIAGLEMPERIGDTSGPTTQWAALVVRASDPYWYDVSTTSATYTTGTPATFFPIFPIRLTSSEVFADATITNSGDVETWPTWVVTGPASSVVLRNITTGKSLTVATTLAAGETLTIDTRPGVKTLLRNDGTSLFSLMTATSSLWPIAVGSNSIRLELSGATVATSATISYKLRYLPS